MTPFVKVIEEIVAATGQSESFKTSEHYHIKIPNPPYMALVIESWDSDPTSHGSRHISVAHYYEQAGDLVPDPEVEIFENGDPIELSQTLLYTQVAYWSWEENKFMFDGKAKRDVMSFLNMWARNLRDQGFIEAARKLAKKGENRGR